MKTGLVTDILGNMPFEDMLDTFVELGIESVWSLAAAIGQRRPTFKRDIYVRITRA